MACPPALYATYRQTSEIPGMPPHLEGNGLHKFAAVEVFCAMNESDIFSNWSADKVGMQARGTTEKAYVEQREAGAVTPTATAPESKATTAPAPAPKQASPLLRRVVKEPLRITPVYLFWAT
jgi:hypothetical protein